MALRDAVLSQLGLPIGYKLDHYTIEGVLGAGSFGITYKAWDDHLQTRVAIKEYFPSDFAQRESATLEVIASEGQEDFYNDVLQKFLEEARIQARFKHPNIITVHRYLEANGTAYLIMDYEEGESLEDFLKREDRCLSEEECLDIFIPVLRGLSRVHSEPILHRDIKPGNIYLRSHGEATLLDFGAARQLLQDANAPMTVILTPGYAAPEQYNGEHVEQGPETDLYGIGAAMYRCLMNRAPIAAVTRFTSIHSNLADPLEITRFYSGSSGHISENMRNIVNSMLALDRKERPRDTDTVIALLTSLRADGAVSDSSLNDQTVIVNRSEPAGEEIFAVRDGSRAIATIGKGVNKALYAVVPVALLLAILTYYFIQNPEDNQNNLTIPDGDTQNIIEGDEKNNSNQLTDTNVSEPSVIRAEIPIDSITVKSDPIADSQNTLEPQKKAELQESELGEQQDVTNTVQQQGVVKQQQKPTMGVGTAIRHELKNGGFAPQVIVVTPGEFLMGSDDKESDVSPAHSVSLRRKIAIGVYEVTFSEYDEFTTSQSIHRKTDDQGWGRNRRPVINVNWSDAKAYTQWLSDQTGQKYRLPTEAEWEFVARSGGDSEYGLGSKLGNGDANYFNPSGTVNSTVEVGSFSANAYNVYDMHGNVWEWVADCWTNDYSNSSADGNVNRSGDCKRRGLRGGGWNSEVLLLRSRNRSAGLLETKSSAIGFRVVVEIDD
ncbi:MAG: sulfatase activating formylglycine-generating enzyme [Oceanicoccus sp.]